MAKRRRYTDDERATAVLFLESEGYFRGDVGALSRVAQRLKYPHQTLSRWAREANNPPPPELVNKIRCSTSLQARECAGNIIAEMNKKIAQADIDELCNMLESVLKWVR